MKYNTDEMDFTEFLGEEFKTESAFETFKAAILFGGFVFVIGLIAIALS